MKVVDWLENSGTRSALHSVLSIFLTCEFEKKLITNAKHRTGTCSHRRLHQKILKEQAIVKKATQRTEIRGKREDVNPTAGSDNSSRGKEWGRASGARANLVSLHTNRVRRSGEMKSQVHL